MANSCVNIYRNYNKGNDRKGNVEFTVIMSATDLPMILAKAQQENKDFYEVLNYYLELMLI